MQWSPSLEEAELALFVVSTTGNGDAPDNCDHFQRFLKRSAHPEGEAAGLARRLRFSVLALGDTNYDKFCEVGKWLDRRLRALGATPLLPLALADEVVAPLLP